MPVTVDALKEAAITAIKAAYGDDVGTAFGFLMFGGYGVPGIVDAATLASKANATAAEDLTSDLAVSLVSDSAKAGLTLFLQATAVDSLEAVGLTAEVVATASTLVVTGIFDSTEIGPDLPVPQQPQQPEAPGQLEQPQQPGQPGQQEPPGQQGQPGQQEPPEKPVAPVNPVQPVGPGRPVGPIGPVGPVVPIGPIEPVGPVQPGPIEPIGPIDDGSE